MSNAFEYKVEISEEHPYFEGHFPSFPVFPAVGQLELLSQAISAYQKQACELIGLPSSKFLQPILPNTVVSIILKSKREGCMDFVIRTELKTITKGQLNYRVAT